MFGGLKIKMMVENKKIGIAGGSGFLGSALAHQLLSNNDVFIIDAKKPDLSSLGPRCHYISCDVTDKKSCEDSLKGMDIVFHRVGLMGNVPSMGHTRRYYDVNVLGTLHVLEACLKNGVEKFIFDSTEAVYGCSVSSPIDENQTPVPTSLYGSTKLICEQAIRMYDEVLGLPTVIFRYSRIRFQKKIDVISILARKILRGESVTLYNEGTPMIDFVDVADVVDVNIKAMTMNVRNEVFNISSGEGISFKDILTTIEKSLGVKAKQVQFESPPRDFRSEHQFGPHHFFMNIDKAKRMLNWSPKITISKSIDDTVNWVKDEINQNPLL